MKYIFSFLLLIFTGTLVFAQSKLLEKLHSIKEISDIQPLSVEPFTEYYQFNFEQPVDHSNPEGPKFKQRVEVGFKNTKAPIVACLEGYFLYSPAESELARLLKGNQISIEHRFFDKSVPSDGIIPWKYLTIKQAADDHHAIIQALKSSVFTDNKWISTGISKGGQTTIFHRYFYPNDVNVSVPYVAPLNLDLVDSRIAKFLSTVGASSGIKNMFSNKAESANGKWSVYDFQEQCFQRRDDLLPLFEKYAAEKGYTFEKVGGLRRAFDLSVLEYQFAFWQWGQSVENIPQEKAEINSVLSHLVEVADPSFFDDASIIRFQPFFYAALTEIGMYDYNIKPFNKYLDDKSNITFDFTFPKDAERPAFNKQQMQNIASWLQTDAEKMLFIYGGIDPWGATAVDLKGNMKCYKYVRRDMSHKCRISSFEGIVQLDIQEVLKDWLKE